MVNTTTFVKRGFRMSAYFNGVFWTLKKNLLWGLCQIFGGHTPKPNPGPRGFSGGFGKLPEDVFWQSGGFQSTLTNFGWCRVGFGVRGASINYFFFMVSQTRLKNKTFLWWTTFLISQRRPSYTCLKILKKKLKNWLCSNFFQKFNLFPNFLVLPQTRPQTKTLVWWTFFLISQRCPSYTCLNKDVLKFSKSSFTLLRLVLRQPFPPNFETSIWLRKKQPGWKKRR